MFLGSRVFACAKKLVYTLLWVVAVKSLFPLFCLLVYGLTGFDLSVPFVHIANMIKERYGAELMVGAVVTAIVVPPLAIVFVLRCNPALTGWLQNRLEYASRLFHASKP